MEEKLDVKVVRYERAKAVEKFGMGMLDQSLWKMPKKPKEDDLFLNIVIVQGVIVGVASGPVLKNTGFMGRIVLEREFCSVTAGKKARKWKGQRNFATR